MNATAPRPPQSAPPRSAVRRPNAVLGLFDAPLYRDGMFWMTAGWATLASFTPSEDDKTPVWFGPVVIAALFGLLPTWIRRLVRQVWRWRRLRAAGHDGLLRSGTAVLPERAFLADAHALDAGAGACPAPPRLLLPGPARQPAAEPSAGPPPAAEPSRSPSRAGSPGRPSPAEPPLSPSFAGPSPHRGGEESTTSLYSSDMLTDARKTLPHPVAHAVRTLQLAHTPKDQYEALLDAAETLAVTVTVTVAALLRELLEPGALPAKERLRIERALSSLRRALLGRGPTFGTWTTWLDGIRPLLTPGPGLIPGLSTADTSAAQPDIMELASALNCLRMERNRAAHGDRPKNQPESALRVAECTFYLNRALARSHFLRAAPWLLTVSCDYEPRSRSFHVLARDATGDHPDFNRRNLQEEKPVGKDMMYTLGAHGPVPLAPFVAYPFCDHCRRGEICYASRTGETAGPAVFRSFGCGHEVTVPGLGDDIRSLPR